MRRRSPARIRRSQAFQALRADCLVLTEPTIAVNIDDCWQSMERHPTTHALVPDPAKFPHGMASLADYVHAKGLLLGIYTSRGSHTCQNRPGSNGFEDIDAQTFASWRVDYLKDDSCKGADPTTFDEPAVAWGQYARMRDALNKTGRPIWFSITARVEYNDSQWHVRAPAALCVHTSTPVTSLASCIDSSPFCSVRQLPH